MQVKDTDWLIRFGDLWKNQITHLQNQVGDAIEKIEMPGRDATDVPVIWVKKTEIARVLRHIKETPALDYGFLADLTATDESPRVPRFNVVYNLFSHTKFSRIRIKLQVGESEEIATLSSVWPAANWAEREVYDMFGIRFAGHPDLRRILMDERWVGHPLRKDYPLRGYQFAATPEAIEPRLLDAAEKSGLPVASEHDPDDLWDESRMLINIGPTHPATHGAFRVMAKLNGEIIEKSYSEFGYTHRAKEKLGENRTYHQFIVYTDRLNYCSALINNVTYAMAVERLMGLEVTDRCVWIRMMCCEISRIIDHLICIGISAVDLGAFSYFLYGYHRREESYTLIEKLCGARLTTSFTRIGGLMNDAPDGWEKEVKAWALRTRDTIDEMDKLLTKNGIWLKRTVGIGVFDKSKCLQYSYSGPNARAAGIDVDLRRDQPCMFYKDVEFDVPICQNGDVFDRYIVRLEEIRQSLNILIQCVDRIKKGPIWCEDKRVRIPEKEAVYNTMEGLIHHFEFFMNGFDVPPGEAYTQFEAANGELGFYIVSRGKPRAHRMRIRGPSFWHYQGLDPMIQGGFIADFVASLGSINIIAGEIDR